MRQKIQDICPASVQVDTHNAKPSRSPIYPTVVYKCDTVDQADKILGGQVEGYAYVRNGHPNADILSEKCRQLHNAEQAVITTSGMSATALAMISQLQSGDHVLLCDRLYGGTVSWVKNEASRLGIESSTADFFDIDSVKSNVTENTKMLVAETISNPMLRVLDLRSIADLAHENNALLLVDNTFASPVVCRPLELGADLVVESMTKIMNGHSDTMLGLLCGRDQCWDRVGSALTIWGWTSSPMSCWHVERGLATLYARLSLASRTSRWLADKIGEIPNVEKVTYPGSKNHPDFATAEKQFGGCQGSGDSDETLFSHLVTFKLNGGLPAVNRFVEASSEVTFCPTLGELSTAFSHPVSTSHRGLSTVEQQNLGIDPGTIRLSVGLESREFILQSLEHAIQSSGAH